MRERSLPAIAAMIVAVCTGACGIPQPDPAGSVQPVVMGVGLTAAPMGTAAAPVRVRSVVPVVGAQSPTPAPQPGPRPSTPGGLLDLQDWYLTLPTGKAGDPDVVDPPKLTDFTNDAFHLDDLADGIVFTANAGGVTTKGSNYPRSELREMNGTEKASWSNTSGTHTLSVRQAVTQVPEVKPDVVTAQIHDAKSDVIEIRLEGSKLIAQYDDGGTDVDIDPDYTLGTPYDLQIVASDGHVRVVYNGVQKLDAPISGSGWYFKTGSYVQSNPDRGDHPDAVGQVVLYALSVEHTA